MWHHDRDLQVVVTPYRVWCQEHGDQFLSREDYTWQMSHPDILWKCPVCHSNASWDDSWYENFLGARACQEQKCPEESQNQVMYTASGDEVRSCDNCPWVAFTEIDLSTEDLAALRLEIFGVSNT